jgi:O-methyltransferase involved in polyketide biosynthesis
MIASSAMELKWMDALQANPGKLCLFIAEGVLPYFTEMDAKTLITTMAGQFPGSELIFDAVPWFLKYSSQFHPLLRNSKARVRWGLRHNKDLENWGRGIKLLSEWYYFEQKEPRLGWGKYLKYIPGLGKGFRILRYRLGQSDPNSKG